MNNSDVRLNGFRITAMEGDNNLGQLTAAQLKGAAPQNTVIFLHGLLGQGRTWRQFVLNESISNERDIFLVDLRNHGDSDHHHSMTYNEMADDLLKFIDSRALSQVTLVGHNIGGKTAMRFAGLYPDRVKGLVNFDTAPIGTAGDKKELTKQSI